MTRSLRNAEHGGGEQHRGINPVSYSLHWKQNGFCPVLILAKKPHQQEGGERSDEIGSPFKLRVPREDRFKVILCVHRNAMYKTAPAPLPPYSLPSRKVVGRSGGS